MRCDDSCWWDDLNPDGVVGYKCGRLYGYDKERWIIFPARSIRNVNGFPMRCDENYTQYSVRIPLVTWRKSLMLSANGGTLTIPGEWSGADPIRRTCSSGRSPSEETVTSFRHAKNPSSFDRGAETVILCCRVCGVGFLKKRIDERRNPRMFGRSRKKRVSVLKVNCFKITSEVIGRVEIHAVFDGPVQLEQLLLQRCVTRMMPPELLDAHHRDRGSLLAKALRERVSPMPREPLLAVVSTSNRPVSARRQDGFDAEATLDEGGRDCEPLSYSAASVKLAPTISIFYFGLEICVMDLGVCLPGHMPR